MMFNASSRCRNLLRIFIFHLLYVQSHSWTVWPNFNHYYYQHHQPPPHHMKTMPWMDPTFNHHPLFHHPIIPSYPEPTHSKNNFANYDYLMRLPTSHEQNIVNNLPLNQSSASLKISNPIVRHTFTENKNNKGKLILYQAPPSYDRIMDPPPSILITSRPFSVTTSMPGKNIQNGEVKLTSSPQVQFSPQQNIAVDGANWNTAVTLQVSLRPGSWTKSKRPVISDEMKKFLPELKYYKKGLKAIDVNKIKSKVEKYVLVSKKEPELSQEMSTQPSITIMANDLVVYPQESGQEAPKDIKFVEDWSSDEEEEEELVQNKVPAIEKLDLVSNLNSNLTKGPSKSIEDIVAEVFAAAVSESALTNDEESDEKNSSQHVKGLSNLFDMIYGKNVSNNSEDELNKMINQEQLITASPDVFPLPKLEKTISISNKNIEETIETTTSKPIKSTTKNSVSIENEFYSDEVTVRCQGMWCHHSTPQTEPVTLKNQHKWEKSGNEINPHDNGEHQVDPLLSYLGLAWPQHDRQSKAFQSTQPTNPIHLTSLTTTKITSTPSTHKMVATRRQISSTTLPLPYFGKNDNTVDLIPNGNKRGIYSDELKDSKHGDNVDINTLASPVTQVLSRENLKAMFNALGHGFGQVMSIVMPLALPYQNQNDPSESSALNLDFNRFFSV